MSATTEILEIIIFDFERIRTSALWNWFTFLDEQLLVAVVNYGVGAVVGGHHAVVGLRAGASVANWETNNKYF